MDGQLSRRSALSLDGGWVLDLDGVIWLGDTPIAGAADACATLDAAGATVMYVTNMSKLTVADQEAKLARHGIDATGRVVASWSDSRGESIRIVAEATDSVLVSEWSSPSESGRTEYALHANGTVQVRDWVRSDMELREFGRATHRRRR